MLRVIAIFIKKPIFRKHEVVVGYRVLDEQNGNVGDYDLKSFNNLIKNSKFSNVELREGKLVCIDGDMKTMPVIDVRTMRLVRNNKHFLIAELTGVKSFQRHFIITDYTGVQTSVPADWFYIMLQSEDYKFHNVRLISDNGGVVIELEKGGLPKIQAKKVN